jgi:hypothetical protein
VLTTIVGKAVQLSSTEGGAIYVFDESEQLFRLRATYGFSEDLVAAVQDQHLGASDAIRQATEARQPQEVADIADEPPSPVREIAMRAGFRARLLGGEVDNPPALDFGLRGRSLSRRCVSTSGVQLLAADEYVVSAGGPRRGRAGILLGGQPHGLDLERAGGAQGRDLLDQSLTRCRDPRCEAAQAARLRLCSSSFGKCRN